MENDASGGGTVWKVATISLGMIASGACAYSFILYSSLSTELTAARIDSNLAHNEIVSLRSELNSTEAQADAVQEKLQSTQARLAAQPRRELPVRLSFHDAVLRSGKVAVLHNLAGADLEVVLEVRKDNPRARRLYLRHGFTEIGIRRGYYQPSGVDAVVMRKVLAR